MNGSETQREVTLVERLFLVCHDERTGKPHVRLDVLGLGLVGASFLELLLNEAVAITGEPSKVARTTDQRQPGAAAQYVLEQVMKAEPQFYTPIDWTFVLRDDLYNGVANSLVNDNLIQIERPRIGRGVRCVPVDPRPGLETLAWIYGCLGEVEVRSGDVTSPRHLLACTCAAMGAASLITARPAAHVEAMYPIMLQRLAPPFAAVMRAITQARGKLALAPNR